MKKPGLVKRALIAAGIPVFLLPGFALAGCHECQYSPNYWGFCRPAIGDGWDSCTTVGIDPWNGTRDCNTGNVCTAEGHEDGAKRRGPFNRY